MSNNIKITGNLTADPTVHVNEENGRVTTVFDIGDNHRVRDTQTGEWRDETPIFWHVVAFGQLAENIGNSLRRGAAVNVTGRVVDDTDTRDDQTVVHRLAIYADDVTPSLRHATVTITKNPKPDQAA
jgi:single-strand DNA-binding protein